jgi:hypothetical protein
VVEFSTSRPRGIGRNAISSDFYRRVRVIGGWCEFLISPDDAKTSHRQGISSSIQLIGADYFREYNCISFEVRSRLSRLEDRAFYGSGRTSIHLPASIEVICEYCFAYGASPVPITFDMLLGTPLIQTDSREFAPLGNE